MTHPAQAAVSNWIVRVLGGLHAGATASLHDGSFLIIGSAPDCDIILRDKGVAPRHLALSVQGGTLTARALDAPITWREVEHPSGESLHIPAGDAILLGRASISVERAEQATAVPQAGETTGQTADETSGEEPGGTVPTSPRQRPDRRPWIMIGAATAVMFVSAALAWSRLGDGLSARQNQLVMQQLTEKLPAWGFPTLTVTSKDGSRPVVEGVLAHASERDALLRRLSAEGLSPTVEVRTGEQLAQAVRHVFQTNGERVQVQYVHEGRVAVAGVAEGNSQVAKIKETALRQIPGLRGISVRETRKLAKAAEPATPPAVAPAPVKVSEPGKVIRGVVDSDPPYLVTADGSHYYEGALLPQGQRIIEIEGSNVIIEQGGKQVALVF